MSIHGPRLQSLGAMVAAVLFAAPPARAATPRAITLAEALVMAQRNDVGVVHADGGAQNARAAVRSSCALGRPTG